MLPEKDDGEGITTNSSVPESYRGDLELLQDLAREYDDFRGTIKNGELFSLLNEIPDPSSTDSSLEESVSVLKPEGELEPEGDSNLPEVVEDELSTQDDQNLLDRAPPSQFKSDKHLHHRAEGVSERSNRLHGFNLLHRAENYNISNSVLSGKGVGHRSESGKIDESLIVGRYPFKKASDVDVERSIIVTGRPDTLNANISNSVVVTPEEVLYVGSYNPTSDEWDEAKVGILRESNDSDVELPSSQNDRYPELEDSVNRALETEFDVEFSPDIFFAEDISEFEDKIESHYRQASLQVPKEFNTERCVYSNVLGESIIHPEIGEMWGSGDIGDLMAFEYVLHESVEHLVDQVRGDNYLFPDEIVGDKSRMKDWKEDIIDPITEYVVAVSGQRLATEYSGLIDVSEDLAEFYFENRQPVNSLESFGSQNDNFKFSGPDKESRADYFLDNIETVEGWRNITKNYLD